MKKHTIRINKFLVLCGLGSRRKVEDLITGGRVKINGDAVMNLAYQVDPSNDTVVVNKKNVKPFSKYYYMMLNKPKGFITTMDDLENRSIVMDLIPERFKAAGIFPVGRLDKDTEGLLLLTNDGDLAYRLTHPSFEISKEYVVLLDRPLSEDDKKRIEGGVFMYGRKTNRAFIQSLDKSGKNVKIIITEGKKRQIRITFSFFGYKVKKLKRTVFGPVRLSGVNSGSYRLLKDNEVRALKKATSDITE